MFCACRAGFALLRWHIQLGWLCRSRYKVLPRCADKLRGASGGSKERPGAEETMNKVQVLIVDDSSVMRKIVERSLRQAGIELEKVFEAGNGAEALGYCAKPRLT